MFHTFLLIIFIPVVHFCPFCLTKVVRVKLVPVFNVTITPHNTLFFPLTCFRVQVRLQSWSAGGPEPWTLRYWSSSGMPLWSTQTFVLLLFCCEMGGYLWKTRGLESITFPWNFRVAVSSLMLQPQKSFSTDADLTPDHSRTWLLDSV